jgi:hypothetical protein
MAKFTQTTTFVNGQTADGGQVNTEVVNLGTSVNNIVNDQITATAAISGSKLDLTTATLDRAKAYVSVANTYTTGTATTVALASESFDSNTMHDTAVDTYKITIKRKGIYLIVGQIYYVANATGYRAAVLKDSSANIALSIIPAVAGGAVGTAVQVSCITELDVANYVYMQGTQTSGGDLADISGVANSFLAAFLLIPTA